MRATATVAVCLVGLAVPALAQASDADSVVPPLTPAEASVELEEVLAAVSGDSAEAFELTDELRDLAVALPYLEGAERRQARQLLARPPDGQGDIFGGSWPGSATEQSIDSGNFRYHWPLVPGCAAPQQGCDEPDLTDVSPDNDVPDYIDKVIDAMDESRLVQNDNLGWPLPKPDGGKGGNDLTDVYVADICNEDPDQSCIFGYASPDDASQKCRTPPFKCHAYLVLDNDYQPAEFDYPTPDIPLQVTAAHEYNHILQYRIDALQDIWMFESTAVWAEEQVFPDGDDWLFYVRLWRRGPEFPITRRGAQGGTRIYGSAVWNHWLHARYGPDVVLDSWEQSRKSKPKDFALGAYNRGIKRAEGRGVEHEFGRFSAATAEWRVEEFGFPDADEYKDVKRKGTLRPGGPRARLQLDHTAYQLLRVKPGSDDRLRLSARAPRGVATAIALVGREGGVESGSAIVKLDFSKRGGRLTVGLRNAQDLERITAVVTNADAKFRGGEGYVHDNERFRAALR